MSKISEITKILNEMSRGILVVDENLKEIVPHLENRNIRVITPRQGEDDDHIKKVYLSKRIFITNNSKDFIDDASSYEYGIIATESLKSKDPIKLAKIISDCISKFNLWSKQHGFILKLKDNGKHELENLTN